MHGDAEGFVVAVDGGPVGGFAFQSWTADSGEDGADDLLAQGKQRGDCGGWLCG